MVKLIDTLEAVRDRFRDRTARKPQQDIDVGSARQRRRNRRALRRYIIALVVVSGIQCHRRPHRAQRHRLAQWRGTPTQSAGRNTPGDRERVADGGRPHAASRISPNLPIGDRGLSVRRHASSRLVSLQSRHSRVPRSRGSIEREEGPAPGVRQRPA